MTADTRSETALVRPFAGIEPAELPMAEVRLFVNDEAHDAGPVILPVSTLAEAEFRVTLPPRTDVWKSVESTPVPTVDCAFVVVLTAHTHRMSTVLFRLNISGGDWPEEIILPRAEHDMILNDQGGFNVTVATVLQHDLQAEPLRPSMAGTWLAKRDFKVGPEVDDTAFSPEELTQELREFYKLPEGVLRFIDVEGVLDAETISDAVEVYLDSDTLRLLLASPTDATSLQLQVDLAIQTTTAVAVEIARALSDDGGVATPESLSSHDAASAFCDKVATKLDVSVHEVLNLATRDTARLRALIEAAFDLSSVTAAALKEK